MARFRPLEALRGGCGFYFLRVLLWWGLFVGMSFLTKLYAPTFSFDVRPLNLLKGLVAVAELVLAYGVGNALCRRLFRQFLEQQEA